MESQKKNKKPLIALLVVALIGIIGGTFAYFTDTTTFENIFKLGKYETTTTETFTSPKDWTPGTTTPKTVTVQNTGNVDVAVRVSIEQSWTKKDNGGNLPNLKFKTDTKLADPAGTEDIAHINFSSGDNWQQSGNYWYYKTKLSAGDSTEAFIDSVTFNKDFLVGKTCKTVKDGGAETPECTSYNMDYSEASYKLVIKVETVQFDAYKTIWPEASEVTIS